jgi:hypothetical protein
MVVGDVPGRWPTEEAVRTGRFLEASAVHRARLTEAGGRIEAALVRGLAIRHDQRAPTPAALIDDLSGAGGGPRQRYSGGEVQEIVKRASELEATAPTGSGAMTIGGVEALAGEVGIAPDTVRAAAASLRLSGSVPVASVQPPVRSNPWIWGPTRVAVERIVDGEVPESEYSVMVDETRRMLHNVGQVSQLGRSFSWVASPGATQRWLEIMVSVRGGRTRITIQENFGPLIGAVFGGVGGGMGGGGVWPVIGIFLGAFHLPPSAIAAIIPLWLVTTYATARTVYHRSSGRRVRELDAVADRLEALARELASEKPALRPPSGPGARSM